MLNEGNYNNNRNQSNHEFLHVQTVLFVVAVWFARLMHGQWR